MQAVFPYPGVHLRFELACTLALLLGSGCGNAGAREDGGSRPAVSTVRSSATPAATPSPACPKEMAQVGRACVDRWEAHLVFRGEAGAMETHPYSERPRPGTLYEARSEAGVKPQGYINRPESEAACNGAGKRLCSVEEWYGACSGNKGSLYPYGAKFAKGACNVNRPHLLSRWFGSNARSWKYNEHFNNPKLNQLEGWLAESGAFEACTSDYGAFDMVGNLHEWVADSAGPAVTRALPLKPELSRALQPRRQGRGVFMGGFYSTLSEHGAGCTFVTMAHEPTYHDYSTGFRCCKDP